jgi:hypothetical protein
MSNPMNAFRTPLGPAVEPGLSTSQLVKKTLEAQQMIHAIMPSTRLLTSGVLQKRLTSENGLFWLGFDLEETPQMPLFNVGPHPSGKRITSSLANLYNDLLHMRDEAESAVIRVGELAMLATKLDSLPVDESRAALGELSAEDLKLWQLIHRRKGKSVEIEFEDGSVNLQLPTLGEHISKGHVRTIRFRVKHISKRQAKLSGIKEIRTILPERRTPPHAPAPRNCCAHRKAAMIDGMPGSFFMCRIQESACGGEGSHGAPTDRLFSESPGADRHR